MQDIPLYGCVVLNQRILCRPGIRFSPIHQQVGRTTLGAFKHAKKAGIFNHSFVMFRPEGTGPVIGIKDQVRFPVQCNSLVTFSRNNLCCANSHVGQISIKKQVKVNPHIWDDLSPVRFTGGCNQPGKN